MHKQELMKFFLFIGKQLLGLFRDMMRKMVNTIEKTKSEAIKSTLLTENPNKKLSEFRPLAPLTDELNDVAKQQKEAQKERLLSSDLSQYKVKGKIFKNICIFVGKPFDF